MRLFTVSKPMESSDNLDSFIAFLKKNYTEFKSFIEKNTHLNWQGSETKYYSNDLEVNKILFRYQMNFVVIIRGSIFIHRNSLHIFLTKYCSKKQCAYTGFHIHQNNYFAGNTAAMQQQSSSW